MALNCKSRFLVISPNPANKSEKKEHFSSFRTNGVVSIDLDNESCGHSESENDDDKEINDKVTQFDDNDECDIDYHLSLLFKIDNAELSTNDDDVFVPTPLKLCKSHSHDVDQWSSNALQQDTKKKRCYDDVSDDDEPSYPRKYASFHAEINHTSRREPKSQSSGSNNSNSSSSSSSGNSSSSKLRINKTRP
jgi:hypothetical protein